MNKKWALFFSGRGSNLEALLRTYHSNWTQPPVLVTNNSKSYGIKVGQEYNLETLILRNPVDYTKLARGLKAQNVECIFLLGYLKILPKAFLDQWPKAIFNLHPSLLPKYPGLKSIQRAWSNKHDIGVSIHEVTEGVDEGQILMQELVIKPKDYDPLSLEEVESLVHSKEHQVVCDFIPMGEKNIV